jgi:ABC-type Na+ efflux pump permease subunit
MTELGQGMPGMIFVFGVFVINLALFALALGCFTLSAIFSDYENFKSFIFFVLSLLFLFILAVVDFFIGTLLHISNL